jgi:hypothetical protein
VRKPPHLPLIGYETLPLPDRQYRISLDTKAK